MQKYIYDQKRRMTRLEQGALGFDYRYDPSDYRIGINAGISTRDFYLKADGLFISIDLSSLHVDNRDDVTAEIPKF